MQNLNLRTVIIVSLYITKVKTLFLVFENKNVIDIERRMG